jgi:ribose 5-phosphate isomerase B
MIALACDHGGFELMGRVKSYLDARGLKYKDFGAFSSESCDYPDFAVPAARAVAGGECDRGIFICGTGIGMSIAANKVPGIRAALCTSCFMAEMTRRHNDANVLALGGRVTEADLALEIVGSFLDTSFDGDGRHGRRVRMLSELDAGRPG